MVVTRRRLRGPLSVVVVVVVQSILSLVGRRVTTFTMFVCSHRQILNTTIFNRQFYYSADRCNSQTNSVSVRPSTILVIFARYISREYGSSLYIKVIGSRSRSQEQKRSKILTLISSYSGSVKHTVSL